MTFFTFHFQATAYPILIGTTYELFHETSEAITPHLASVIVGILIVIAAMISVALVSIYIVSCRVLRQETTNERNCVICFKCIHANCTNNIDYAISNSNKRTTIHRKSNNVSMANVTNNNNNNCRAEGLSESAKSIT